jgi:diketogulonate reductase-like aldo/keto reductase
MASAAKLRTFHSTASGKKERLSTLLRELPTRLFACPKSDSAPGIYSGGVEPLLAAIEYGVCLIDKAEVYRTLEIARKAIEGQRDGVFRANCCLGISMAVTQLQQHNEAFGDFGTDHIGLYRQLHWRYPTIPIEEPMNVLGGLTLYAKGRRSM